MVSTKCEPELCCVSWKSLAPRTCGSNWKTNLSSQACWLGEDWKRVSWNLDAVAGTFPSRTCLLWWMGIYLGLNSETRKWWQCAGGGRQRWNVGCAHCRWRFAGKRRSILFQLGLLLKKKQFFFHSKCFTQREYKQRPLLTPPRVRRLNPGLWFWGLLCY